MRGARARQRRTLLAIALALVLGLAACGTRSSSHDSAGHRAVVGSTAALPAATVTPAAAAALPTGTPGLPTPPVLAPGGSGSCAAGVPNLINVDLTTQELVASADGQVVLSTPITSGGAAGLRTPTGCFSIFRAATDLTFYSPWPAGSPYYYPPMFVAYALEFLGPGVYGGYTAFAALYLHSDPNEPDTSFGPGSESGQYASEGCVQVPTYMMQWLFPWAVDGTAVYIHY
ncbi:MAG: L,D-transpeptidase [Candidatus Dormibacteria bacterium]